MSVAVSPPPSVPSTRWDYGASVPYASLGIAQDLSIYLSPGNDDTIVGVYLSSSAFSAGTLPAHNGTPPGAALVGVAHSGRPSVLVPDQETRAAAHIGIARLAGTHTAAVSVTGERAGKGINSSIALGSHNGDVNYSTTSATWVDVTGGAVTVATSGTAQLLINGHVSYNGANNLVGQIRVLIDNSEASDATTCDGQNAVELASLSYITTSLTAGAHAVKLQTQKVSGSGSVSIAHCDLLAMALQAVGGA